MVGRRPSTCRWHENTQKSKMGDRGTAVLGMQPTRKQTVFSAAAACGFKLVGKVIDQTAAREVDSRAANAAAKRQRKEKAGSRDWGRRRRLQGTRVSHPRDLQRPCRPA